MAIKGKRAFYQKGAVYIKAATSNKKLSDLMNVAFQTLTTDDQRIVVAQDQSEWHLNKLDIQLDHVFLHIVHFKPGYQRSGYRKRSNQAKVVSISAGVDTEFVLHDVCCLINGNDIIMYGGIHNDKTLYHYINGLLKKADVLGAYDFVKIENVLKRSTVQDIERYGVADIDLDAVQNSEVIGIGAQQRSGLLGRLINSPLAQHEKIKINLHIGANGLFRKSKAEIAAQMESVAKDVVGNASEEDWDGIKITLKNGMVLKKGAHLVSEDLPISRISDCLNVPEAAPLMLNYFNRLKSSKQLVRD